MRRMRDEWLNTPGWDGSQINGGMKMEWMEIGGGCEDMKGGQPISSDTADQVSGE